MSRQDRKERRRAKKKRDEGFKLKWKSKYAEALAAYKEALSIYRSLDDAFEQSSCLNDIGAVLRELGRYEEAVEAYRQALEVYRRVGDGQEDQGDCLEEGMRELRDAMRSHEEDAR